MGLFGTSGIRGRVGQEITIELFRDVGRAIGAEYEDCVVGHDPRTSSEMLESAFVSALLSTGRDCFLAGMVSTPTLAWAGRNHACGAMITASHNPPEYNGVKLWNPNGLSFVSDQRARIEERIERGGFAKVTWGKVGRTEALENAIPGHIDSILNHVAESTVRVVVDCGGGATSEISPRVLERMGCEVIRLNCKPDGRFRSRGSEPVEKNLAALKEAVRSKNADLGIAHDGDGDRMVAIDEKGNYAGGDALLPAFAKEEVKSSLVVPINGSMVLDDILPGAKVWRTRVGDVFVGEEIEKRDADFGGEPSGTWIFPRHFLCPDGVFAAAKLVNLVARRPLSELVGSIPRYPLIEESVSFEPSRKREILSKLKEELEGAECASLNTIDGWRLEFEDGWVLVRPSGTEPKIRITAEAREEDRAKEIYSSMISLVREVIA
ncbi:MAG: phosphoglucosamine mutase [Thermoplasmata archaeon]|nr:phosphoglucosamine mutase [Thermoplasmata archaeon]